MMWHAYTSRVKMQNAICCTYLGWGSPYSAAETCWGHRLVIAVLNGHQSQSYRSAPDSFRLGYTTKPSAHFVRQCTCLFASGILAQKGLISEVAVASHLHRNRSAWCSVSQMNLLRRCYLSKCWAGSDCAFFYSVLTSDQTVDANEGKRLSSKTFFLIFFFFYWC